VHVVNEPTEGIEAAIGADAEAEAHVLSSQCAQIEAAGDVAVALGDEGLLTGKRIAIAGFDRSIVAIVDDQRARVGPRSAPGGAVLDHTTIVGVCPEVIERISVVEV
jgi:hypothetical protein